MSFLSSVLGGIFGVALAILLPGPLTFKLGFFAFTIGMGIGSYIDPVTPDIDSAGQPQIGDLRITTALEGAIIPEMLGTSKLVGNIFYYWGDRSEEVTEEMQSGKSGGSTETVTQGWKYYLSWCQGICMGPMTTLYAIYAGDDLVWEGELDCPAGGVETLSLGSLSATYNTQDKVKTVNGTLISTNDTEITVEGNPWDWADTNDNITPTFGTTGGFFPVPYSSIKFLIDTPEGPRYAQSVGIDSYSYNETLDQTVITLLGSVPDNIAGTSLIMILAYNQQYSVAGTDTPMGTCRFYFGTTDQPLDSAYEAAISDPTLASAFRGLCYAVFDDCYIGPNRTCPTISIVAKRNPVYGFSADETLNTYDYNPAHAIYHIIEGEDRLLGLTGYCDETTFASAASTLATEERGIGLVMDRVASGKDWVETILKHVRGMLRSSSDE